MEKEILSSSETTKFLSISKSKLYNLTRNENIPYHMIGGKYFFLREELLLWVKNNGQFEKGEAKND